MSTMASACADKACATCNLVVIVLFGILFGIAHVFTRVTMDTKLGILVSVVVTTS